MRTISGSRWLLVFSFFIIYLLPLKAAPSSYFRIVYRGSFSYALVYVEHRFHGRAYRGRTLWVRRRSGPTYRIVLKRFGKSSAKKVYLPPRKNPLVVFRVPGGRRKRLFSRGSLSLLLKGRFHWVWLYINGRRKGKLFRGEERVLRLAAGRRYRIQAMRKTLIRTRFLRLGKGARSRRSRLVLVF